MAMTRSPGWQKRLIAYLATAVRTPFKPGVHDCALFGAGAVAAITGVDHAAPYRGRYTTLRGGMRILRRDGFADHIALAAAHLGERRGTARPGDLAVIDTPEGPALGVVQGASVYVLGPAGLHLAPVGAATTIFEV